MKPFLSVALVQFEIEWEDIDANLQKLDMLLTSLKKQTDIILLPEMFATGFTMNPERFKHSDIQKILDWMSDRATRDNVVLMGTVPFNEGKSYFNRLIIAFEDGSHDFYDKRHLFSMGGEQQHYLPGKERKIVIINGWKILPLICYDLRFPVWSRNDRDYDLLIYLSNWPAVRSNVWNTLLPARAIENQAYVAGVNRIGTDGRAINYIGESKIVTPKGELIAEFSDEEKIGMVQLDADYLVEFRKKFPVLSGRDIFFIK